MRDLTIGKNEAGQRMDKYLKKYFPEAGSGFLYKMLRKKNILLNEKKADGKEMLKQGDRIRLYLAEETIEKFRGGQMKPAVSGRKTSDIKLDVIYEDDHVAIVNKPAGILSQKAKPSDLSLVEYFQRYLLETGAISEQELETFHPAPCNRFGPQYQWSGVVRKESGRAAGTVGSTETANAEKILSGAGAWKSRQAGTSESLAEQRYKNQSGKSEHWSGA